MNVNKLPVFVSSADSYRDIWPAFFTLFKRYWPEYDGTIYLNTQQLDYTFPNLNIVCTKLGPQKHFSATFKAGLDLLPQEDFLLLMIDYFFEDTVNVAALQHFYDVFCRDSLDTLTLNPNPPAMTTPVVSEPDCLLIHNKGSRRVMFGYQAAFWRRASLRRVLVDFENPWRSEFYGSQRFAKTDMRFYCLKDKFAKPIKYDESGVLHGGGKWLDSALKKIDLTGVPLDLAHSPRKHYKESRHPVLDYCWTELTHLPSRIMSEISVLRFTPSKIL